MTTIGNKQKGKPTVTFLIIALLLSLPSIYATPIINPSATGANSQSYSTNYENIIAGSLLSKFNSTIQYTVGSTTYLTVPEYQSSTACLLNGSGLVTTYLGNAVNGSIYEVRSDAFSEAGIALSMSNRSNEFDAWVNFVEIMDICGYGNLPCWVVARNNSIGGNQVTLAGGQNDTAIDGDVRVGIALYLAANNTNFTSGNRTRYFELAKNISRDVYIYDTISITTKATRAGVNVTRLPMGGGDCASSGLGCSTDMWVGYLGDIIKFFQYSYIFTGNATYDAAARNFTAATYSVSLDRDTDGDGFGVAPFNFNWNTTGTYLGIGGGGGVNTYHYDSTHEQWDDSDAPRFMNFCDILRVQNLSAGSLNGPYLNASAYCIAWSKASVYNATTTSLQYYYNGTCATNCNQTGYYPNGLGVGLSTFYNTSYLSAKVNESISHYGWTGNTVDSTSCGTGVMFRAVKMTKGLGTAIGYDERWVTGSSSPSTPACSQDYNGTDWNITTDTNISGYYCNIKDFIIQPGVTVTISAWNGTNATGWAKINATGTAYILGTITGDGNGYGGGSGGGGGGGACGSCGVVKWNGGSGGSGTNQNGTDGNSGTVGNVALGRDGGNGGSGGTGFNTTAGGGGATGIQFGQSSPGSNGGVGVDAQANADTTYADNASIGFGGGGGGGGAGEASQSGNDGAGGGGGGMGGDGGAALIIKARNITINGTINSRAGQNSCSAGSAGGNSVDVGGTSLGGTGASNTLNNCAASNGGAPGTGGPSGQEDATYGGRGGGGAGGSVVLNATSTLNYAGGVINVTGGTSSNGGTVKLIYSSLSGSGIISGASTTVVLPSYSLSINVTNIVNLSRLQHYNYELIGPINISGSDPINNIVYLNTLGDYSIRFTNIELGSYFPVNSSFTLTANNVTVNTTTQQSLINITATRRYLYTTINNFNATNAQYQNTTSTSSLIIPANNGSNNLRVDVPGNFSINETCDATALTITQCTIEGFYDAVFKINATITTTGEWLSNFTIISRNNTLGGNFANTTTTNGTAEIPVLQGYSYFFTFNETAYASFNATLPSNASVNNYSFSLQPGVLNFTFYDEQNNSRVIGPNITMTMVSPSQSAIFTTTNGTIITSTIGPDVYTVQYSSTNYTTRFYLLNFSENDYTQISLPMLLNSAATTVTVTVTDTVTNPLVGAIVKVYLYDLTSNSYRVNQIITTGTGGTGIINIQLNDEFYYFTVEYQGEVSLITTPSQIYGTTLLLTVPLTGPSFGSYFDNANVVGTITNTTGEQITFTYVDQDNIASQGCIYAYNVTPRTLVLYNYSCTNTSSGTLSVGINTNTNGTYYVYGIVVKNGAEYTVATQLFSLEGAPLTESTTAIWMFVMLLIMVTLIVMFSGNPVIATVLAGVVPVLFSGAHLISIGLEYTIPLLIISFVVAVVLEG